MRPDWYIALLILAVALFACELIYFRMARKYRIIDKPNDRSSHVRPVIRGGGIIFALAVLFWFLWSGFEWPWFVAGIMAAATISFIDDRNPQPAQIRFVIHFLAVLAVFYSTGLFQWPVWLWTMALIVSIGALNAFNFMDGINGITGVYSLVMLVTFALVNAYSVSFTDQTFILTNIVAVVIFLFFNFRKKAACFAGDVGSVSMALILVFLLLQLIYRTGDLLWVLLFFVYGVDAVVTILYRLSRRENIFQPHRTHLYQYLSNELRWPHRVVSALYGIIQLVLNGVLFISVREGRPEVAIISAVVLLFAYLAARRFVTKIISARNRALLS